jgi:hypothetical protein
VKCNGNYIDLEIVVDRFRLFIDVNYIPAWRDSGGQVWHCDLLKIEEARPSHSSNFRGGSGD